LSIQNRTARNFANNFSKVFEGSRETFSKKFPWQVQGSALPTEGKGSAPCASLLVIHLDLADSGAPAGLGVGVREAEVEVIGVLGVLGSSNADGSLIG